MFVDEFVVYLLCVDDVCDLYVFVEFVNSFVDKIELWCGNERM